MAVGEDLTIAGAMVILSCSGPLGLRFYFVFLCYMVKYLRLWFSPTRQFTITMFKCFWLNYNIGLFFLLRIFKFVYDRGRLDTITLLIICCEASSINVLLMCS